MADHDAQLLANRIAMLESEQTRLMKKIDNTRKRADQINDVKRNNELRAKRLADEKERQDQEVRENQLRILQERK